MSVCASQPPARTRRHAVGERAAQKLPHADVGLARVVLAWRNDDGDGQVELRHDLVNAGLDPLCRLALKRALDAVLVAGRPR